MTSVSNVILIVSDTLRKDYLGMHGAVTCTPNLNDLARTAVNFDKYHAASFPTLPARGDLLTGVYSFVRVGWNPLPRSLATVPEIIRGASDIVTAAVVDTPFYLVNGYHYDRGFEYFYEVPGQRADNPHAPVRPELLGNPRNSEYDYCPARTAMTAARCLERLRGSRFFLLVDMWDPHEPWDAPEWYVRRYKPDYDGRVVTPPYGPYREWGLSDDDLETAIAGYRAEITMVDRWIGHLLETLDGLGLSGETAVIFVSDHGFYFGERGGVLGKMSRTREIERDVWLRSPLYREITNVPCFLRVPGVGARLEESLVSAIDVAPTVLDLFGIEPPSQFLGQSLLPCVRQEAVRRDRIALTAMPLAVPGQETAVVDDVTRSVAAWQPITVTSEKWSMLYSVPAEPVELYEIESDPAQSLNVAASYPDVISELHDRMINELRRAGISDSDLAARM